MKARPETLPWAPLLMVGCNDGHFPTEAAGEDAAARKCMLLVPVMVALLSCGCSNDENSAATGDPPSTEGPDAAPPNVDGALPDGNDVAAPPVTVTGPITGGLGAPFTTSLVELGAHGYGEKEFFYEGEASAYALVGEMTADGKWQVMEASQAQYKSRMIVRRPLDASQFNGTVVLEWLNVSGGADGDPGYMYNWEEILREGYVWIGVSAQATGIEGGGFALLPDQAIPLKQYDPERYGSLSHPGDAYSFDIYTRAAQIVRGAGDLDVLDGLQPERLIAYGESQSAMRLVSYVNGVHPSVTAFDGFFIHSRSASGVAFSADAGLGFGGPPAAIRDDIEEPVFQFQTETDVHGSFGYLAARQPDTDRLRTWEVAGTAHADAHILGVAGDGGSSIIQCDGINDGPQHFVIKAALHALNVWMTDGTAPATGELLTTDTSGAPVLDEHGNTLGGVRSPAVDVPIATLSGNPPAGSSEIICILFGSTTPFTPDKLLELYPTHDDYVTKVTESAAAAQDARFLLEPEAQTLIAEAEAAPVPN